MMADPWDDLDDPSLAPGRLSDQQSALAATHLPMVRRLACKYRAKGTPLPLEDLVGAGSVGLVRAASKYEPSRGLKFSTYAMYWVRNAMLSAIQRERSVIDADLGVFASAARFPIRREVAARQAAGESETEAMQAVATKWGRRVTEIATLFARDVRIDQPYADGDDRTIGDTLAELSVPATQELGAVQDEMAAKIRYMIRKGLDMLMERERQILVATSMVEDPKSYVEIAAQLGITRQRVHQMRKRAIQKLKAYLSQPDALELLGQNFHHGRSVRRYVHSR